MQQKKRGVIRLKKGDFDRRITNSYDEYTEEFIVVNELDNVLKPIYIPLPECPPDELIDNYGLFPKDQYFRYEEYPRGLIELEKKAKTVSQLWEILGKNKTTYKAEIEFLERQNKRREEGFWIFIRGVRTYIPKWQWLFLNWFNIDVGLPDYRSRDRKFFAFAEFCYTDTMDFVDKDKDGWAVSKNGVFHMEDTGRRICYGFNYPKFRREGATYKAGNIIYEIISGVENAHGGIQSMDGPSGKKAFQEKIVDPWRRMKFFLKPLSASSSDPKTELLFDRPAVSARQAMNIEPMAEEGLMSKITFANSANRSWYDGDKLFVLNNDECGKTTEENVEARWGVQQKCLSTGSGLIIHGFAMNTSTVGEMEKGGGDSFFKLCDRSHYHQRTGNGQTRSGLYNLFLSSFDGMEGFVDNYGNSIIEDPKMSDLDFISNPVFFKGKAIGAKTFLEEKRDTLLNSKADNSLETYEEEVRMFPLQYEECFIAGGADVGFNLQIVQSRIKILRNDPNITRTGNFEWTSGPDSSVKWVDNVNGRFTTSLLFDTPAGRNRSFMKNGTRYPLDASVGTISADPFKFMVTSGGRMSKFGGAGFLRFDPTIDLPHMDISEWRTNRFVFDYLARPAKSEIACEDMIMACIYYGFMIYPEINHPVVWDYFVARGYGGFLKYAIAVDGRLKKTPGFNSLDASKQDIFNSLRNYIEVHGHRERHIRILDQIKAIKGIDDMKNYDLFTAAGGCLLGDKSEFDKLIKATNASNSVDIGRVLGYRGR